MSWLYHLENRLKYHPLAQQEFFKRKISWEFPLSLNIETTNYCNFHCFMCPRGKGNRGFGNMDFKLYQKIIKQLAKEERKFYVLTLIKDGEPLLHPKLSEMIALAQEKKVAHRVEIFTNGLLLDEKKGKALIESGLDVLNVSLNAAYPKTHQKITGTKSFPQVVENLKKFMRLKKKMGAKKPLTVAKAIEMEEFEGEALDFKKQWSGIVDQVIIAPYHNYGGSRMRRLNSVGRRWPCLVLWFNPVVNFDGKVTTCCVNYQENELIMGDIKKQTLKEIWQSPKYQKLRGDHLKGDLSDWPTCQKCDYWQNFVDLGGWLKKHNGESR